MGRDLAIVGGLAAAVSVTSAGLAGCPAQTTTTIYTPVTGILVRTATLVADHGCGTEPGQVYRYAAVVSYANDGGPATQPGGAVPSGVFDCFTDGLFSNLVASDAGSLSFSVAIYAFDFADFPPALNCSPPIPEAGTCPGDNADTVLANVGSATWTTTCTAVQQSGVTAVAVCGPLTPTGGGGGGGGAAGADAGADADAGAGADAEAGADAGADVGADAGVDGDAADGV
jgi:hypothetical protein